MRRGLTARARTIAAAAMMLGGALAAAGAAARPAAAATPHYARADSYSTGWYPDQPRLAPGIVSGGTFGQLFSAPVRGQVYAQPVVADDTLLVASEDDEAYGLDPRDGSPRWNTHLGTPWNAADLGCADLAPHVGVTGTPIVDDDTDTEYLFAKTYARGTSGPAQYAIHALDVSSGAERAGFPVVIAGRAANASNVVFDATHQLQRPGLLLMGGVVYAGFGGHCDRAPYTGWVVGVSTAGRTTTMWTTQVSGQNGSGIWQSGGPLISDGPGRILLATGNGHLALTGPTPGRTPPGDLSESVVRLRVQPNGSFRAEDFFTPFDAAWLDKIDADFGSGGPVALPESYLGTPLFGTQAHPHLMVEVGKAGYIYLVDRDDLGGYQAGPGMSDASLARIGSFAGVWSTPTVWPGGGGPGGGGYVYITHSASVNGPGGPGLRAYRYGVDASGLPTLAGAGQSSDPFGFGSGSPVVTSAGLDPGSALLWVVWQTNGSGNGAQLRAYDPVPVNGILNLRWSAPIGTAVKFAPPGVSDGRVYVGTRDGHVLAFGSPIDQPVVASPGSMSFPPTIVQQTTTQTLTLRATRPSTVTSLASNSAQFVVGQPSEELPADLDAGDTLSVPVTFAPSSRLITSGTLTATVDDAPDVSVALSGVGRLPVGDLYSFPGQLSLGGAPIGGAPLSAALTFSNVGAAPLRVTGTSVPPPSTYFSVTGLPAVGGTLAPGQSIIATVVFRPSAVGLFSGAVSLATDAAAPGTAVVTVPLSAGAAPPSRLAVSQSAMYFGPVRIGSAATRSVLLRNAGQSVVTITKSKPPAYASGLRPVTSLPEGTMLAPGETRTLTVTFQATRPGHFTDTWLINGNDGSGLHTIVFDAYASLPRATNWMVDGEGRVYTLGAGTSLGNAPVGSARAVTVVPTPSGLGYYVSDYRGRVFAFGDARALGTVPPGALQGGEVVSTMSVTPSGNGYWIFTSAGRVFRFGDAAGFGDLARVRLNQPIVASVATPSGQGYYMIGADGGVFSFGDAPFLGSVANLRLNQPVVGLVPTAGRGYWLVASDGGVFAFGDASFRGSMGSVRLNAPITGMVRYGNGYLMVAVDGGLFNFSSSPFVGSLSGRVLPAPIVGVAAFTV